MSTDLGERRWILHLQLWHNWYMVPKSLQGVLWSRKVENLDLDRDAQYIIHQILAYGGLEEIHWASKSYGGERLKRMFVERPMKIYSPRAYNFAKKILFNLPDTEADREKYDQTLPRRTR